MTPEPERITFEVERIAFGETGHLEVTGRWYGVRGRRFMRPTLTFKHRSQGNEQRALADLEHKPWAAEDGDEWTAAFPLEVKLEDTAEMELAVAPDITVPLAGGEGATEPGPHRAVKTVTAAPQARSPRIRADPVRGRPREHSPELQRLRERLTVAEESTERERAKREAVGQALEDERRAGRRLRAELGRVRAELELAGAVQRELDSASTALDALRSQARDTGRRLESTAHELEVQRSTADRLGRKLAEAEAAVERLTAAEPEPERGLVQRPRPERVIADRHHPVPPRSERPLNPSLRSGGWLVRGLAVVMMVIVIVAIVLVIRSTVG